MSTDTKQEKKCVIWSNLDLDTDDWREGFKDYIEANELDLDPNDEDELYKWMIETNDEYLSDERLNLNIQLNQPIVVIGDLGLWNGRATGYKILESGNISDCLYDDADYAEWYVDNSGDLRADAYHHDGVNHYRYRVYKEGITDDEIDDFLEKIYDHAVTEADIQQITDRLGDHIAKVYGFEIPQDTEITSGHACPEVDTYAELAGGETFADRDEIESRYELSSPSMKEELSQPVPDHGLEQPQKVVAQDKGIEL